MKAQVRNLTLGAVVAVMVVAGCGKHSAVGPEQAAFDTPIAWNDLNQVADSMMANRLDENEMAMLFSQSTEFQVQLIRVVANRQEMPSDQIENLVSSFKGRIALSLQSGTGTTATTGACTQPVEYKTVVRDPVWAYTYTSANTSRGVEYYFYYNPWWTVNSDNIRWASGDGQVTWALWVSYGSLTGYNLCGKPFFLQTGDKGTWLAGGAYRIFRSMYVHHT